MTCPPTTAPVENDVTERSFLMGRIAPRATGLLLTTQATENDAVGALPVCRTERLAVYPAFRAGAHRTNRGQQEIAAICPGCMNPYFA